MSSRIPCSHVSAVKIDGPPEPTHAPEPHPESRRSFGPETVPSLSRQYEAYGLCWTRPPDATLAGGKVLRAGRRKPRRLRGAESGSPEFVLRQAVRIGRGKASLASACWHSRPAPFLTGRSGRAEPCLRAGFSLQMRAVGNFRTAIADHRAAGATGQGLQRLGDLHHDRLRALFL